MRGVRVWYMCRGGGLGGRCSAWLCVSAADQASKVSWVGCSVGRAVAGCSGAAPRCSGKRCCERVMGLSKDDGRSDVVVAGTGRVKGGELPGGVWRQEASGADGGICLCGAFGGPAGGDRVEDWCCLHELAAAAVH